MADFFNLRARQAAAAQTAATSSKQTAQKDTTPHLQPWVEKYRPKTLDDITAQDHTVTVLRRTLQSTNLPHMLFYGPPGTGKTSTILALAKQLYGPMLFRSRVLELNASDERGIAIVREKVKDFARMQLSNPPSGPAGAAYREQYPCPPYKIIVLDEADSMTQDAQSALRRTMETYSKITRFCLVCNYVTRIIEPLASRCSKFRFKSLDEGNAGRRLQGIAEAEGVKVEGPQVWDGLLGVCEGDLRRAITVLQSAARLVGASETKSMAGDNDDDGAMDIDHPTTAHITLQTIQEIAGVIPTPTMTSLLATLRPPSAHQSSPYAPIARAVENLIAEGWSAASFVTQLYERLVLDEAETVGMGEWQKVKVVGVFSEVDKRLLDGCDEHLTVLDLCLRVAGIWGGR
ncbi:Replication factor C subunit 2 [Salinomyces thailandicus]|uniref:Replication factor C subunit 2 n=1 Tax=Salinomyces thailandicus TaxID=706561 RepID=A0A4V6WJN0_9PEZI|nr:Replication factor C subunit 2 [Salinomyces thailandica]